MSSGYQIAVGQLMMRYSVISLPLAMSKIWGIHGSVGLAHDMHTMSTSHELQCPSSSPLVYSLFLTLYPQCHTNPEAGKRWPQKLSCIVPQSWWSITFMAMVGHSCSSLEATELFSAETVWLPFLMYFVRSVSTFCSLSQPDRDWWPDRPIHELTSGTVFIAKLRVATSIGVIADLVCDPHPLVIIQGLSHSELKTKLNECDHPQTLQVPTHVRISFDPLSITF